MQYLVNSREMKRYDRNTTECLGIPSAVLMERAALAAVEALREQRLRLSHVLVVCGSGNNGGDGYAVARLLLSEGIDVDVVAAELCEEKLTEENRLQQNIFRAYGGKILAEIPERTYTVVVDALFGVGLSREVEGHYARLIEQMNALSGVKVALDIASGISADDGSVLGRAFRADLTIAFAFAKLGNVLWPGREYAGRLCVKHIGIDPHSFMGDPPGAAALEYRDLAWLPKRAMRANKGSCGKLLIIAGSRGMAGAACLCARAAYVCGCGLVRVFTAEENRVVLQTRIPEAVLDTYSDMGKDGAALSDAIRWADAIVCGPGLGVTDNARIIVQTVSKQASVPVIFDADALNLLAKDTTLSNAPQGAWIVTPHLGEMSRLTGLPISRLGDHILESAEAFAAKYNVICVLKDAGTVTAVPRERTYWNPSGNAGMATAGSGDVLSGVIGSLTAQGMPPGKAAPCGVFLHGLAGDIAKEHTGERSLMASDLTDGLQRALSLWEEQSEWGL